jgi:hypothetical protein
MTDEFEWMWKKAVVACFKILFQQLPVVTQQKYEKYEKPPKIEAARFSEMVSYHITTRVITHKTT